MGPSNLMKWIQDEAVPSLKNSVDGLEVMMNKLKDVYNSLKLGMADQHEQEEVDETQVNHDISLALGTHYEDDEISGHENLSENEINDYSDNLNNNVIDNDVDIIDVNESNNNDT